MDGNMNNNAVGRASASQLEAVDHERENNYCKKSHPHHRQQQQLEEDQYIYSDSVGCHDVLPGGANQEHHRGNINYRRAVEENTDAYYAATTQCARMKIALQVIYDIKRKGGRFLIAPTTNCAEVENHSTGTVYRVAPDDAIIRKFQKAVQYVWKRNITRKLAPRLPTDDETLDKQTEYIYSLVLHDVILGTGLAPIHHEGNINFQSAVQNSKDAYFAASSQELRNSIIFKVIADVKLKGGKFLRQLAEYEIKDRKLPNTTVYQVVPDSEAIDKFMEIMEMMNYLVYLTKGTGTPPKPNVQDWTATLAQSLPQHQQDQQQQEEEDEGWQHLKRKHRPTQQWQQRQSQRYRHHIPPSYAEDQSSPSSTSSILQRNSEHNWVGTRHDTKGTPKFAPPSLLSSDIDNIGAAHRLQRNVAPSVNCNRNQNHGYDINHVNGDNVIKVVPTLNDRSPPESWPAAPPLVTYTAEPSILHTTAYTTAGAINPAVGTTNYYGNASNHPTVIHHTHHYVLLRPPAPPQPQLVPMYQHHPQPIAQPRYSHVPAHQYVPQTIGQMMVMQPPNPNYYTPTTAADAHQVNYGHRYSRNRNTYYINNNNNSPVDVNRADPAAMDGHNMDHDPPDQHPQHHHRYQCNTDTSAEHGYAPDEPPSSFGNEEDYRPITYQSQQDEEESRPTTTSSAFYWFEEGA